MLAAKPFVSWCGTWEWARWLLASIVFMLVIAASFSYDNHMTCRCFKHHDLEVGEVLGNGFFGQVYKVLTTYICLIWCCEASAVWIGVVVNQQLSSCWCCSTVCAMVQECCVCYGAGMLRVLWCRSAACAMV